ncbi:MAG TPA: class I SAM-dependent methyltransferase [Longimicrobiales bacterium]
MITAPEVVAGVFRRWLGEGLIWLPERGMGFLPITARPYDRAYWEKYERYARTDLGRELTRLRVELVRRHAGSAASAIDVGIGCGQFVLARGANTYGFDINPVAVVWLKDRRLWRDPREQSADALTFWDSIEHIPDPAPLLQNAREWVFASLPIVPGDGPPRPEWRHYRPDEHCWYWTRRGFLAWMEAHGFRCVEHNTMESLAGREDIETFAFRRGG